MSGGMLGLSLCDTRLRAVAGLLPLTSGEVGMYTCGPTVYSPMDVGNLCAYVVADLVRRVLEVASRREPLDG